MLVEKIFLFWVSTLQEPILALVYLWYNKLVTIVEANLKALFLIATTLRCRGGLPLVHTLSSWMLSKETSSTSFFSLWYDSIWYWTPVSRTIGKHSTHYTNGPVIYDILSLNKRKGKQHKLNEHLLYTYK